MLLHLRDHSANRPEDTLHIDIEAALKFVDCYLECRLQPCVSHLVDARVHSTLSVYLVSVAGSRIVHDYIDATPFINACLDSTRPVLLRRDVHLNDERVVRLSDLGRGGFGALFIDVADHNAAPFFGEALRYGGAEARSTACGGN